MDLWQVNSNAWPLSETIERHAKAFKWLTGISHDKGPRTGKRSLPLSVLVIISKPKKEKQDSISFSCLNTLLSPLRRSNYFKSFLKVPVLDLERFNAITGPLSNCNWLYRSGALNWNMVNSKFHLIQSFFEIFA